MWGVLAALACGLVLGGLGTLGAVLAYAKRHPGLLIHAAFEYGLDQPEAGDGSGVRLRLMKDEVRDLPPVDFDEQD